MTAAQKSKTQLSLVPDLSSLESTLTKFAAQQAPMLSRMAAKRQDSERELEERAWELKAIEDREAMIDRLYQALKTAFAAERADLEGTMSLITHGTMGAASTSQGE